MGDESFSSFFTSQCLCCLFSNLLMEGCILCPVKHSLVPACRISTHTVCPKSSWGENSTDVESENK